MGSCMSAGIDPGGHGDSRAVILVAKLVGDNVPGDSIIENLPTEMLQKIMMSMDAETLLAFIRTSKRVHLAYQGASNLIALGSSEQSVGPELLPIAVNCFMARALDLFPKATNPGNKNMVFSIAHSFIKSSISTQAMTRKLGRTYFSLQLALRLQSFHQAVVEVFDDMYLDSLRKDSSSFIEYTLEEKTRVLRALYLFELVHLLLVPVASFNDWRLQKGISAAFWKNFAPWDHSQVLYLVEDFLSQRVIKGSYTSKGPLLCVSFYSPIIHVASEHYSQHFAALGDQLYHRLYPNYGRGAPPPTPLWCPCHQELVCDWHRVTGTICPVEAMMVVFVNGIQGTLDMDSSADKYIEARVTMVRGRRPIPTAPLLITLPLEIWPAVPLWDQVLGSCNDVFQVMEGALAISQIYDCQDELIFLLWTGTIISSRSLHFGSMNNITGQMAKYPNDFLFRSLHVIEKHMESHDVMDRVLLTYMQRLQKKVLEQQQQQQQ
ncbi:hypothetical protein PFICI_06690 [Pestalotiopsis fici W106-1]|uniref:F-box domain-containing protein n=1 Tax=Pestalotiopsis fici (strain W106-1 / CGMCC3.15140) TaxID=1229662 RepID=W3X6E5_PESFW|nr:uncharacterized protein PFICI_06690 [Pestalotiopsis fici W106-1]ETS81688.1 hypothetical protein PFICI_06690 [Pestalotiopsis fici W106-1]